MNMRNILMALVVIQVGLTGCVRRCCVKADYIKNASGVVKSADWSAMETVTVSLKEFSFSPSKIVFKKNTPYKLEIRNDGTVKHYFTAGAFFKAVATRKVQSNSDGEIKAPYFTALEVFPGRSLDFYFIPVKAGTYDLTCTIEGHAEKGMTGHVVIE